MLSLHMIRTYGSVAGNLKMCDFHLLFGETRPNLVELHAAVLAIQTALNHNLRFFFKQKLEFMANRVIFQHHTYMGTI